MTVRFSIMARRADNGEVFECFTWTRDEASGIRRAYKDAEAFGVEVSEVWAEEV